MYSILEFMKNKKRTLSDPFFNTIFEKIHPVERLFSGGSFRQ